LELFVRSPTNILTSEYICPGEVIFALVKWFSRCQVHDSRRRSLPLHFRSLAYKFIFWFV